jgi:hypothetical protein
MAINRLPSLKSLARPAPPAASAAADLEPENAPEETGSDETVEETAPAPAAKAAIPKLHIASSKPALGIRPAPKPVAPPVEEVVAEEAAPETAEADEAEVAEEAPKKAKAKVRLGSGNKATDAALKDTAKLMVLPPKGSKLPRGDMFKLVNKFLEANAEMVEQEGVAKAVLLAVFGDLSKEGIAATPEATVDYLSQNGGILKVYECDVAPGLNFHHNPMDEQVARVSRDPRLPASSNKFYKVEGRVFIKMSAPAVWGTSTPGKKDAKGNFIADK